MKRSRDAPARPPLQADLPSLEELATLPREQVEEALRIEQETLEESKRAAEAQLRELEVRAVVVLRASSHYARTTILPVVLVVPRDLTPRLPLVATAGGRGEAPRDAPGASQELETRRPDTAGVRLPVRRRRRRARDGSFDDGTVSSISTSIVDRDAPRRGHEGALQAREATRRGEAALPRGVPARAVRVRPSRGLAPRRGVAAMRAKARLSLGARVLGTPRARQLGARRAVLLSKRRRRRARRRFGGRRSDREAVARGGVLRRVVPRESHRARAARRRRRCRRRRRKPNPKPGAKRAAAAVADAADDRRALARAAHRGDVRRERRDRGAAVRRRGGVADTLPLRRVAPAKRAAGAFYTLVPIRPRSAW